MNDQWRIVAVDWSGSQSEREQRAKIWCCEAVEEAMENRVRLHVRDLRAGCTRRDAVAWLIKQLNASNRLLVGLDFAFSLPRGYVAQQLGQDKETWLDVVGFCRCKGETILKECSPPFWGRAGTKQPSPEDFGLQSLYRETEEQAKDKDKDNVTAKSVFQIGGAGAVGTGTLRGIPLLRKLQKAGFAIWPFDAPREGQSVVVEIYPRLFSKDVRKSDWKKRKECVEKWCKDNALVVSPIVQGRADANDDAFDAFVSAIGMWQELRREGYEFERHGTGPAVQSEGWIWGVSPQ